MADDGAQFFGEGKPTRAPETTESGPLRAIPIILVPGVMASHLRVKPESEARVKERFEEEGRLQDYTNKAWAIPPLTLGAIVKEVVGRDCGIVKMSKVLEGYGPKLRQVMLNPDTTEVDEDGYLPSDLGSIEGKDGRTVARARGWGGVNWDAYGSLLKHLQGLFNPFGGRQGGTAKSRKLLLEPLLPDVKRFGFFKAAPPTEQDFEKAVGYCFPVFAYGYNWTQSNLTSAERLLQKIETWIKDLQEDGYTCSQVILVTHSMGGLVARIASGLDREGSQRIFGVIHGVMPSIGAPLLFRRMVAGMPERHHLPIFCDLLAAEARIIGRTRAETTAVAANAPGVLELLPSHLYPPGWLHLERDLRDPEVEHASWPGDGEVALELTLPKGNNPYREIYKEREASWRMVEPELLDPAGHFLARTEGQAPVDSSWEKYIERMEAVENRHRTLLDKPHFHHHFISFYGEGKKTFSVVRWQSKEPWQATTPKTPRARRYVGPAQDDGDGTVPITSGNLPTEHHPRQHVFSVAHLPGFNSHATRVFTILGICILLRKWEN